MKVKNNYWYREFGLNLWLLVFFIFMLIFVILGLLYSDLVFGILAVLMFFFYVYHYYKFGFHKIQHKLYVVGEDK